MWWTIFTAADLYIGLIVLDAMPPSLAPQKLAKIRKARRIVLGLLVLCGIVLLAQVATRYGWLRH